MSEIRLEEKTSSVSLTEPGMKFGFRNVVTWVVPHISKIGALVSVLCAVSVLLVSGGSTTKAIEGLEGDRDRIVEVQRIDREKVAETAERLAKFEATQESVAILATNMVTLAQEQGVLTGKVESVDGNVKLILDALLRLPSQAQAQLAPADRPR